MNRSDVERNYQENRSISVHRNTIAENRALDDIITGTQSAFDNVLDRVRAVESRDGQMLLTNLAPNSGFENWELGTGPFTVDNTRINAAWRLRHPSLASVSVSRAAFADVGSVYSVGITYTHVTNNFARIQQTLTNYSAYDGRPIAFSARVRYTGAGTAKAFISTDNGATFTYGDTVVPGGVFQTVSISLAIPSSATVIIVGVEISGVTGVAYVDNVTLVDVFGPVDYRIGQPFLEQLKSGFLELQEMTTPVAPLSTRGYLYLKGTAGGSNPYFMSDAGVEYDLLNPSTFTGPLTVTGDLTVTDDLIVGDTLSVTGNSSFGTITAGIWNGTTIAIANGGTGATSASAARTNLGLGTIAVQNANAVSITGGSASGMTLLDTLGGVAINTNVSLTGGIVSVIFDGESVFRRDTASATPSGTTSIVSLQNRDLTNGNLIPLRFVALGTDTNPRSTAFIYARVDTHGVATTTSAFVFQTANASATPGTRLVVGNAGAGIDVTGASTFSSTVAITGATTYAGAVAITLQSAAAFTVAQAGTDYAFQVDTNTASSVTGIKVTSAALTFGVNLAAISSGASESLTINAKGSGLITLANTSTGGTLLSGITAFGTGGAPNVNAIAIVNGSLTASSTSAYGILNQPVLTATQATSAAYIGRFIGTVTLDATVTSSTVYSLMLGAPTIVNNGSGLSATYMLRIISVMSAGTENYGIYVDSGTNRFLGSLIVGSSTGGSTAKSILEVGSTTGAILTLARNDASVAANEMAGKIQFHMNDAQTSTNNIIADIEAQATNTIATDINPGRLLFRTTAVGVAATPTERMRIDEIGNVGINIAAFGTNAAGVLGLGNGTAPTTSPIDMIQLFSVDASAGNATLGIRTEAAVVTEAVVSDRTVQIVWNGTVYKVLLKV